MQKILVALALGVGMLLPTAASADEGNWDERAPYASPVVVQTDSVEPGTVTGSDVPPVNQFRPDQEHADHNH
jgi:hypothetical protein